MSSPDHSDRPNRRGGESRDSSSSCPPGPKKPRIAPPPKVDAASKRLYFSYRNPQLAPAIEKQLREAEVQDLVAQQMTALADTQPEASAPLLDVLIKRCSWNRARNSLTVLLRDVPNKDTAAALKGVVAYVLNIPTFELLARRHEYATGLAFYTVRAVQFDHNNHPSTLDAMETLLDAIRRTNSPAWTEALDDHSITDARWGPIRDGPTATLFISLNDTSSAALANLLVGSDLVFFNGTRTAMALQPKETLPQCGMCWRFGHRATQCRIPQPKCVLCGSSHEVADHDRFVAIHGAQAFPTKCVNCLLPHRSDSKSCDFYRNRSSQQWVADAYDFMTHIDDTSDPSSIPGLHGRASLATLVPKRKAPRPPTPTPTNHTNVNYIWRDAGEGSHRALTTQTTLTQLGFKDPTGAPPARGRSPPSTTAQAGPGPQTSAARAARTQKPKGKVRLDPYTTTSLFRVADPPDTPFAEPQTRRKPLLADRRLAAGGEKWDSANRFNVLPVSFDFQSNVTSSSPSHPLDRTPSQELEARLSPQ